MASEGIRITPRFSHLDIHADDFGPEVPPEVLWQGADCEIRMTLVHYDSAMLDICLQQAMGGARQIVPPIGPTGIFGPIGTPMGSLLPLLASGNFYMSLNLASPVLGMPWHFPACYLTGPPVEIPLGTERTLAVCIWRAIPYVSTFTSGMTLTSSGSLDTISFSEILSSGAILWDRNVNT